MQDNRARLDRSIHIRVDKRSASTRELRQLVDALRLSTLRDLRVSTLEGVPSAIGPGHAPSFHATPEVDLLNLQPHASLLADIGHSLDSCVSPPFDKQKNNDDEYRRSEQYQQLLAPFLLFHGYVPVPEIQWTAIEALSPTESETEDTVCAA